MWADQNLLSRHNTDFFWGARGNAGNGIQTYDVPDGASMLLLTTVGSGGAGRPGFNGSAGVAKGGGPGGASGGIASLLIRAALLPATLYIQCGGGPPGGNSGNPTYIGLDPAMTAATRLLMGTGGGLGAAATSAGNTAGGTAGALVSAANAGPWSAMGVYTPLVGQNGANGGAGAAAGSGLTWGASGVFISGGTGGAGCTTTAFAGGLITGNLIVPSIPGGLAGLRGEDGARCLQPLCFQGGTGGGSSNSGIGGVGGDGDYGCGGGGGGAGVGASADGGFGGPGFAFITAIF